MEIKPSRKRFTVEIAGETFKTQKSLIERVLVKKVFSFYKANAQFYRKKLRLS